MDELIRSAVERQFPELSGGYHLPRFGLVMAVPDAPHDKGLCDDFRPRFAVDVQVLLPDGSPDPALPILAGLPVPVPNGGAEAGFFGFPEEGTTVVICFAYGLPHKPFIQQVLPHGLCLPSVPKGDQLWQHSEACQQRVDADGNWHRLTDGKIHDQCIEREVESMNNTERHQSSTITVDDHATESVGGVKKIEALGSLKLLSGGSASLAAVDDLHQASGRDLNLVVGQTLNSAVAGDLRENVQGQRRSTAPTTWLGSEEVNVLQVLCDLIDLVDGLSSQLAAHTHLPGPAPTPTDAAALTTTSIQAKLLAVQLKVVTA